MPNNISYEEIISIQRKANIVDIVRDYVPLTQRGRNFFGICPFHDDHNPSMSVSSDKQMYKCFVCGNAGNVFNFIMEYEKVNYYEAVKIVADKLGISVNIKDIKHKKEDNINKRLYDMYDIAYRFYQNNLNTTYGKVAKKYLKDRKLNDDIISKFNIGLSLNDTELSNILINKGYTNDEIVDSGLSKSKGKNIYDLYVNRIMFPLYDLDGRVIAFSGRIYNKSDDSKYINTKETKIFIKGNTLYNYHNAKKLARKEKSIIIVEGFMDVIRLNSVGIENVVATMGTAVTKMQASLIEKLAPNIILMFDGDEAGNKATQSYLENYNNSNVQIVRLEDNLDPDEYILKNGVDKMKYHLSHPMSIFEYKLSALKNNIDFNNEKQVSEYITLMVKEIEKIDDDVVRDLQITKLSSDTNVDKDIIKSKINTNNINKVFKINKPNIKISKYEKAEKYIIYRMLHDNSIINYYFNNLSYLPDEKYRKLATEILQFYKKFDSFNINDFIIYLKDKKELINLTVDIDDLDYSKEELEDSIDNYFNVIKEYMYNEQIKKLTNELKNEINDIKRKEIAKKIVDIKMKESKKE